MFCDAQSDSPSDVIEWRSMWCPMSRTTMQSDVTMTGMRGPKRCHWRSMVRHEWCSEVKCNAYLYYSNHLHTLVDFHWKLMLRCRERERERERERRDRQRDRQTERQIDRETDRQIDRETESQRDRERQRNRETETERQRNTDKTWDGESERDEMERERDREGEREIKRERGREGGNEIVNNVILYDMTNSTELRIPVNSQAVI